MSSPNNAIKVENLSKRYRIGAGEEIHDTLAGAFTSFVRSPIKNLRRLQRLTRFREDDEKDIIWALKDISFDVQRGEVLGVIGHNGAGKSTLLKVLSRITYPTQGRIEIDGRVASLLEVGTGFHPELTGRENIYLNGTILGMTRAEIDQKFDEIVSFSGIDKFIDTPVKRYSSGMRVRLAFSVAAHLEPEILLVDEVLAVGDLEFQQKSLGKMEAVAGEGRTVIFVSHNISAVRKLCSKVIVLENGTKKFEGETNSGVNFYLRENENITYNLKRSFAERSEPYIKSVELLSNRDEAIFFHDEVLVFRIVFWVDQTYKDLDLNIALWDKETKISMVFASQISQIAHNNPVEFKAGFHEIQFSLPVGLLGEGHYYLNMALHRSYREFFHREMKAISFQIQNNPNNYDRYQKLAPGKIHITPERVKYQYSKDLPK